MNIALLNLQYDNNYGGNLQRYALMTVLQRMGHDVTHLNLRCSYENSLIRNMLKTPKRLVKKFLKDPSVTIFSDEYLKKRYDNACSITDPFYDKYINHTDVITNKEELHNYTDFDAFVVGSDQVWRKDYASLFGIETFFFDWIPDDKVRLGYAVSLGTNTGGYSESDFSQLSSYYSKFNALSVRESSSLEVLERYGWTSPKAEWVLDPTLLLSQEDYMALINDGTTKKTSGDMFCYILDPSPEKNIIIKEEEKKHDLQMFDVNENGSKIGIQQWLRSFYDAKFVVTDSYHGLLFSLIFNKPFRLILNDKRGNARFESILKLFGFNSKGDDEIDRSIVNKKLYEFRKISYCWLLSKLNTNNCRNKDI